MNDLIDRSALMEYPFQRGKSSCDEANANMYFLSGVASVLEYAKNLPSVPAEVVRHGRWIASKIPCEEYVCSVCGGACWYYEHTGKLGQSNFCPNCGSRMDGQGKRDSNED